MKKERPFWRKFLKITLTFFSTILFLVLSLFFVLKNSRVQTWLTQKISEYLSEEYGTTIKTGKVDISIFNGVILEDLFVADQQNDTLLFINSVNVLPKGIPLSSSKLNFSKIHIDSLYFNLYQLPDSALNMQFLLDSLSGGDSSDDKSNFRLKVADFKLENSRFYYKKLNAKPEDKINYSDLQLSELNLGLEKLELHNNDIKIREINISTIEKSGFKLSNLLLNNFTLDDKGLKTNKLALYTPESFVELQKVFLWFSDWDEFNDFSNKVNMQVRFSDSTQVTNRDLNFFLPNKIEGIQDVKIGGLWHGTLNKAMVDNFNIRAGNLINLNLNAKVKNITNLDSAEFYADINDLRANIDQISNLKMQGMDSMLSSIPKEILNMRQFDFNGSIEGSLQKYNSSGELSGLFGNLNYRITGGRDTINKQFLYGQLVADNIDLKQLSEISETGKLFIQQDFKLILTQENKLKFETVGIIDSFDFKGYKYKGVNTYLNWTNSQIDSLNISLKDKNIDAFIHGMADFSKKTPKFKFNADINHIDLYALNLYREKYPASLNFNINADFSGTNIDDFVGNLYLTEPLSIKFDNLSTKLENFEITGIISAYKQGSKVKRYIIDTDPIKGEIELNGNLNTLIPYLQTTLSHYAPTFISAPKKLSTEKFAQINANFTIKNTNPILQFIDSSIFIAPGSRLEANYDSQMNDLQVLFHSSKFKINNIPIKDLAVNIQNTNKELFFKGNFKEVQLSDNMAIRHIQLDSKLHSDSLQYNLTWDNLNDTLNTKADFKGLVMFKENNADSSHYVEVNMEKSDLYLEDKLWQFQEGKITSDSSLLNIDNLNITHKNQTIKINGSIAKNPDAELNLSFKSFDINNLNSLLPDGMILQGKMNGNFHFRNIYSDFIVISNDTIKNLKFNQINLGDMYLNSDWNKKLKGINFSFYNKFGHKNQNQNEHVTDSIYGTFWPAKDSISAYGFFNGFNLRTFSPLYQDYIDFVRGSQLTGNFKMYGFLKDPRFEGDLNLKITSLGVNYLETKYSVNKSLKLKFNNNSIHIDTTMLFSRGGGNAILYGDIKHNSFKNFNLDIALQTDRFQFMNMQPTDTSLFYGTAYGSGYVYVRGKQDDILVNVNIETDKNTSFYIPLSSSETLDEEQNFMVFVNGNSKDSTNTTKQEKTINKPQDQSKKEGKLTVNMALAVTPGAEIQLIMDEQTGDIIKARGNGNLQINLKPDGDLNMFGDYTITKGDYLFTLQNFFSKHFTIKDGGTIHWTGIPEQADIKLSAMYSLPQTGIYSLLLDPALQNAKTHVDCVIDMEGALLNPAVKFGINFPKDEYRLQQHLKILEQDEINEQFLSLLLIGSFQPLPGLSQEAATGSPVKIGELLSNQLNRHLSGISKDLDVGLNYQTGNDMTTDELAVELRTRLWDDRITIGTNFGVGGGLKDPDPNAKNQNLVGELDINLKLNPQGSIQLRAFNKANDDYTYANGLYTQGVGFFWRREFDKFRFFKFRKNESQKNKPDSIPPILNDSTIINKEE